MKRRKNTMPGYRKAAWKRKTYQEFMDGLAKDVSEKRDVEELFKRVLVLDAENVLKALAIREKNDGLLEKQSLFNGKTSDAIKRNN